MATEFTFLHLTDLHWGEPNQHTGWEDFQREIERDLLVVLSKVEKPVDVIFFTGDLIHRGEGDFYEAANRLFGGIYRTIAKFHVSLHLEVPPPYLLAVPGNHDSKHPNLEDWPSYPELPPHFWRNSDCAGHNHISKAFAEYSAWKKKAHQRRTFRMPPQVSGILPGDFISSIPKGDLRIGIVGLNSAFLQLNKADMKGRLQLNVNQLFAMRKDGDFQEWVDGNGATFLMTHHHPSWLACGAEGSFGGNIAQAGCFTLHLLGHEHSAVTEVISVNGAETIVRLQGRALSGAIEGGRTHGFSIGVLEFRGLDTHSLAIFPRKAEYQPKSEKWTCGCDLAFETDSDDGTDLIGSSAWRPRAGDRSFREGDIADYERRTSSFLRRSLPWNPKDLAQYLFKLAQIAHHLFKEQAGALYEQAASIYQDIGLALEEGNCIAGGSDVLLFKCRGKSDLSFRLSGSLLTYDSVKRAKACELIEQARRLYRGYPLGVLDCEKRLGDIHLGNGEIHEARNIFSQILKRRPRKWVVREKNTILLRANCTLALADSFVRSLDPGDLKECVSLYEKAKSGFREARAIRGVANCLNGQGDAAIKGGDHVAAAERYRAALEIYYDLNPPNYYWIGMTQCSLGKIAANENERSMRYRLARVAWQAIYRDDLVEFLNNHEQENRDKGE